MNVAVFSSATSWHFRDLQRAAAGEHRLTPVDLANLTATVDERGDVVRCGPVVLNDCDAALVRAMPPGGLEPIVFRMDALARLAAAGVPVVNPPRAIEASIDKYLTTARLAAAGLTVPATVACEHADDALAALNQLGGDVVVKPLFGGEGRGLVRIADGAQAARAFTPLAGLGSVFYLQRFVPHEGCDWRLLVVGEQVWGMRRRNPNDWRTNISCGGVGEPLDVTHELAELALRAAAAVGASIAGVDLLPGVDGTIYALEVNASPGWRTLAEVTGVDVAERMLAHLRRQAQAACG